MKPSKLLNDSRFLFFWFLFFGLQVSVFDGFTQNYASTANGNWTTGGTWTNTSGWGSATPPLSGQGSGTISVNHDITISGNYSSGSAILNVAAGKTLTINGDLSVTGGSTINVSGILYVTGNVTLSSVLNILPGGQVIALQDLTVNSSNYLSVGTNVASPPFADLAVYGNIISNSSGDITVNQNGRVAVFGDVTASGGGTLFTINNGGQVYVEGDIAFTGGGSQIVNNNPTNPYGLYVGGSITNSGGGSSTTGNQGDEEDMENTNPDFFNWVANLPNSSLPVTLLYFSATLSTDRTVVCSWATSMEKDADYFAIERSTDGLRFIELGTVRAAGNSSIVQKYSFNDTSPLVGRNYYRLKEVDLDKTTEYFNIVLVGLDAEKDISIYPNPANPLTETKVALNFDPNGRSLMRIIDTLGRQIFSTEFTGLITSFPVHLQSGCYLIEIRANERTFQRKFIVP